MMNNKLIFVAIVAAAILTGCSNADKETEMKLNDEVMAIHNEIMPKMGEINRLKRQLKTYKEVLPDDSVALKIALINSIMHLSKSEDMMSDWMSNYKYPNPEAKHDELIAYLNAQKDSIKQVSDTLYMSLATAKVFLNNMPDSIKSTDKK